MQNEWIKIFLEFNGCLIIGYLLYHFLFRKNNRHSWNRIFLVTWPLLCLVIATAQINWTVWKTVETNFSETKESFEPITYLELADNKLPLYQPNATYEVPNTQNQQTLVAFCQQTGHLLYWIGTFIMAFIFLYRLGHLRHLIRYSTPTRKGKYTLLEHPKLQTIFSFGPYIFNPKGNTIHPMILEHELVHVRQRHSLDLLWMEVLVIFNWFNPVIYLYRKKLKETHEFIADQSVVKQFGLLEYARLLVSQATQQKTPALGTPFAAFTKKRILTMKTKTTNRWSRLRYGVVLPLFLLLMTAFAIKKIERQRPVNYESEVVSTATPQIAAQVTWGDLTCDCFASNLKGAYFCDISVISLSHLEKLTLQVPKIKMNNQETSLLSSARSYSATIYKANDKKIRTPVEFADGFFTPDDQFWKNLGPGDKIKFRATLAHGQVIEFPVALEGNHPEKIIQSFLQNEAKEVIPFDNISYEGKMKMTVEAFKKFSNHSFSLIENGKPLEMYISINSYQGYYGPSGSYGMEEAVSTPNSFKIKDLNLFHHVAPGENLTLYFKPQDKRYKNLSDGITYKLKINILGEHPIYQKEPRIVWNGKEIDGTTFYIKEDEINDFKHTLPKIILDGEEINYQNKSFLAKAFRQGNLSPERSLINYKAGELQDIINQKLDMLALVLKEHEEDYRSIWEYARQGYVGIPTPDGHLFPFEIRFEGIPRESNPKSIIERGGQAPYFNLPIEIKQIRRMSSGFGERIHPITKEKKHHRGIDLVAPLGTLVNSVAQGEVIKVSRNKNRYGNKIVIQHADGYRTVYAHLQNIAVKEGERLQSGQHIGTVGSTGESLGPHLHFEIIKDGKPVDPLSLLPNISTL